MSLFVHAVCNQLFHHSRFCESRCIAERIEFVGRRSTRTVSTADAPLWTGCLRGRLCTDFR